MKRINFLSFLFVITMLASAQKVGLTVPSKIDFEGETLFPWVVVGDAAKLTTAVVKNGNKALEIASGSSVQSFVTLTPNSTYQLSVWVKTNSGSDEVQVNVLGLAENNTSAASALVSGDKYFPADKYDPAAWAKLAKAAGMKYMNMTTMHHDGYALFESKYYNAFTSKQTHNRDFVKEYVDACRAEGLKVGLYKTLINWRYPGYYDVTGTDCKRNPFGYKTDIINKENARIMKEELYCQVKELMTNYGKIDHIFWDGGWLAQQGSDADAAYFWEAGNYLDPNNAWPVHPYYHDIDPKTGKPLGLMGMIRKYQPDIIVNPRSSWYGDIKAEEGGAAITGGIRSEAIYEKCMSIAPGWGYTNAHEDNARVQSTDNLKRMLADCVIRNMVFLLNVGPDRHGQIPQTVQNRLLEMGKWLEQVGEAVYGTRGGPWNPKDGHYGYAYKGNTIYVYLLSDFKGETFTLPAVNKGQKVVKAYVVSDKKAVKFNQHNNREITLSGINLTDKTVTIIAVELNKDVMN